MFADIPTPEEKFIDKCKTKQYSDYVTGKLNSNQFIDPYDMINTVNELFIPHYWKEDYLYTKQTFPGEVVNENPDEESFYYILNKDGFRCKNFNNFDKSKKNILFMGCSVTFGVGLPDELTWASMLTEKIKKLTNIDFDVYNIALPGSGVFVSYKNFIAFLNQCGIPDYVFMMLPETTRGIMWDEISEKFCNGLLNSKFRQVDKKYGEQFIEENNLFYVITAINSIETICNLLGIKLIWTSWNDVSHDVYDKFEFKNFFPVDFDHPLYLVPPTISNSKRNFDKQIKKEKKSYEKHFNMLQSLNKNNKPFWLLSRDNMHPGVLFSEFYSNKFFQEFEKIIGP